MRRTMLSPIGNAVTNFLERNVEVEPGRRRNSQLYRPENRRRRHQGRLKLRPYRIKAADSSAGSSRWSEDATLHRHQPAFPSCSAFLARKRASGHLAGNFALNNVATHIGPAAMKLSGLVVDGRRLEVVGRAPRYILNSAFRSLSRILLIPDLASSNDGREPGPDMGKDCR